MQNILLLLLVISLTGCSAKTTNTNVNPWDVKMSYKILDSVDGIATGGFLGNTHIVV